MIILDPEKVQYEIAVKREIVEIHPMPLEVMKLLGICKEIKEEDTKEEKENVR